MRIMFVAGFFSPVLDQLKAQKGHEFEERSVIWIPQYANRQINLTQFKSDFNDQVAQGATDILVVFFLTSRRSIHNR